MIAGDDADDDDGDGDEVEDPKIELDHAVLKLPTADLDIVGKCQRLRDLPPTSKDELCAEFGIEISPSWRIQPLPGSDLGKAVKSSKELGRIFMMWGKSMKCVCNMHPGTKCYLFVNVKKFGAPRTEVECIRWCLSGVGKSEAEHCAIAEDFKLVCR